MDVRSRMFSMFCIFKSEDSYRLRAVFFSRQLGIDAELARLQILADQAERRREERLNCRLNAKRARRIARQRERKRREHFP